jgi:carboxypeptidase C (cathepsin A)
MSKDSTGNDNNPKQEQTVPEEKISQTVHSITIKGEKIDYSVSAGTFLLKEEDFELGEKAKASVFYVAYTRLNIAESSNRPVTFSFNGGPGSSSVWMHLGLLGPKRVLMDDEGFPLPPPYRLVENEYTLLDKTDLIFIDPVSTGYSRAVPKEKPEQYHNIKTDIESVGEFIRLWTTRNNRWSSPKFLIGESYGTTRAGGLSEYLQERYGMYLNGIMLVSSILNFITADFSPGNDLPYILFLPTYAATAWYHKKLDTSLQKDLYKTLEMVKNFAANEYNLALMKGSRLQGDEKAEIVKKLARYTGLSPEYIESTNLRINIHRFVKELRRADGLTIGRLDSRYTGFDSDEAGEFHEGDPSYHATLGTYAACLNDYVRRELGFEMDTRYEILSNLYDTWNYDEYQNRYVNTAEKLRKAIQVNPALKVIVCNGYFDLATPFFATEYTFDHINLPEAVLKNISMVYYESGHMMYVRKESLAKVKQDLTAFIESATRN